jgi:hypothetical protein
MRDLRRIVILVIGPALCWLAGCSNNPLGREKISGKVTFQGKPLDAGEIEFSPLGQEPTQSGTTIKNGVYNLSTEHGLPPGTYRVMISSMKGGWTAEAREAGRPRTRAVEQLPAKYNTKSELTVEVKKGGANRFDFDLTQ